MRTRFKSSLLCIALVSSCSAESDPERPSIVFISVDTLSARHTSLYGYERETTPGLDQLATSSVVFDRCWSNAPWTAPSYMSQFTGLQPASFRRPFGEDSEGDLWSLAPEHEVLAELFQDAGYRTAGIVDNFNAGQLFGLERGFEYYDESAAKRGLDDVSGGIDHAAPLALEWLDALDPDEPFFLFLQVLDVHGPYLSGSKWKGELTASSIADRTAPVAVTKETMLSAIPKYTADPVLAEGQTRLSVIQLVDDYDRGIRSIDAALTDFVAELNSRDLLQKAWLVISADHGESMVEHESYFNHLLLHGEELHVPLIVRPPGGVEGHRVGTNVQLVDLLPSFLDVGGLPHPKTLHGRSFLPAVLGQPLDQVAAFAYGDFEESRSVIVGDWNLVETNPLVRSAGLAGFFSSPSRSLLAGRQLSRDRRKGFWYLRATSLSA
ncbi:MAG: arylsulfatase A-like enzyme [Planctomycetota bacterium]|jgi:arylsulfatase A-like enzyme